MNEYSINDLFDSSSSIYNGAVQFNTPPPSAQKSGLDGVSPATLSAGELQGNTTVVDGFLKSQNYVAGSTGWYLDPTTGEFNFGVSVDSLDIPDTTTANSMHVESDGDTYWGVNVASGFAAAPASISKAGAAIFKSIQVGGSTLQYQIGDGGIFTFGDGSDGDVVISGNTTLTRDMYYDDLTVDSGITLSPAGYRIFVKGTLTVNGTIERNGIVGGAGNSGNGGAGGAALADGYLKGSLAGAAGGNGGNPPVVGTDGTAVSNALGTSAGKNGGAGGQAGGNPGAAGGTGGASTAANVKLIANWHLATLLDIASSGSTVKFTNSGSSAGGGGGRDGGAGTGGGGGGGGSAGGILAIYAKTVVISATGVIQANGGAGGAGETQAGTDSGGGGGGGGGNGGIIVLSYNSLTNAGSITATGGAGGAGGTGGNPPADDNGTSGTTGASGVIYQFQMSL